MDAVTSSRGPDRRGQRRGDPLRLPAARLRRGRLLRAGVGGLGRRPARHGLPVVDGTPAARDGRLRAHRARPQGPRHGARQGAGGGRVRPRPRRGRAASSSPTDDVPSWTCLGSASLSRAVPGSSKPRRAPIEEAMGMPSVVLALLLVAFLAVVFVVLRRARVREERYRNLLDQLPHTSDRALRPRAALRDAARRRRSARPASTPPSWPDFGSRTSARGEQGERLQAALRRGAARRADHLRVPVSADWP